MVRNRLSVLCVVVATLVVGFAVPAEASMQYRIEHDAIAPLAAPLAVGAKVKIDRVPVDGKLETLELERFEVFAKDADIKVFGPNETVLEQLPPPAIRSYRGKIAGDPDSMVFVAISGNRIDGVMFRGDRRFGIGSARRSRRDVERDGRPFDVYIQESEPSDDIPLDGEGFVCDLENMSIPRRPTLKGVVSNLNERPVAADGALSSSSARWIINLAIDTDYELYQNAGSSSGNVTTFINNLIGAMSTIYDRELNAQVVISYLGIQDSSSDPFTINPGSSGSWNGSTVTYSTLHALLEFGDRWHNSPPSAAPRSLATLISGKSLQAGVAWVDVLCQSDYYMDPDQLCGDELCNPDPYGGHYFGRYSYNGGIDPPSDLAVPNPDANAPTYTVPNSNYWPLLEVAHEIGHNVFSGHTHCRVLDPPDQTTYGRTYVDQCNNTQGGCYSGTPSSVPAEKGTIMSYCHLLSGGASNLRFIFGKTGEASYVIPNDMRTAIQAVTPNLSAITAPASLNSGSSGNASVTNVAGVTYAWTITNGVINSGQGTSSINFTANTNPTTVKVVATNAAGCSISDSKAVTVNASCSYQLSKSNQSFTVGGGSDSVNVTVGAGCAWTASESQSWITINSGTPGSGNGTLSYTVSPNGGAARSGVITIAGQSFTVNQSGCSLSVNSSSFTFTPAAAVGSINITANGSACAWTASESSSFISITSATAGSGNATINFTVAANDGTTKRSGNLTIAGQIVTVTQWPHTLRGDFDGDGHPDIVWRNKSTGENRIWRMDVDDVLETVTIPSIADLSWELSGVGDFNADGRQDIVWRQPSTGYTRLWYMNGTTYVSGASLPTIDGTWALRSVNDWNDAGSPDLVWRRNNGTNPIHFYNGSTYAGYSYLPSVSALLGWSLAVTGDATGDGDPDIVWRNTNGRILLWRMNGMAVSSAVDLPKITDLNWTVAAMAKYNADATDDIVLHNRSTGQVVMWFLTDGTGTIASTRTLPAEIDTNWEVVAPR